jgi:hypothetical protein
MKKEENIMTHLLRRKAVMVSFLVQVFFVFLCISPIYLAAAEKAKPAGVSGDPLKMVKEVQLTKEPTIKIAPKTAVKMPANIADRKANLHCSVKVYYDQQLKKPIEGHVWDLSTASVQGYAPPWYVYWEIVVTNSGTAIAKDYNVHLAFTNPYGMSPAEQRFDEAETLAPGEAEVLKYRYGPFGPGATFLYGKNAWLITRVDYPSKINESNEIDNSCENFVNFVP